MKFRITSPDGKTYNVTAPEGTTQEEALAYFQQQQNPDAARQEQIQQFLAKKSQPPTTSGLAALARGAGTGLAMGFDDELYGAVRAIGSKVFGADEKTLKEYYEKYRDDARASEEVMREEHPYLYGTGDVVGMVGGALIPGGIVARAGQAGARGALSVAGRGVTRRLGEAAATTTEGAQMATRAARSAPKGPVQAWNAERQLAQGKATAEAGRSAMNQELAKMGRIGGTGAGAAQGATVGALRGAGETETLGDIPEAALTGAATGAAVGGAFPAVASTVGRGLERGLGAVETGARGLVGKALGQTGPASTGAVLGTTAIADLIFGGGALTAGGLAVGAGRRAGGALARGMQQVTPSPLITKAGLGETQKRYLERYGEVLQDAAARGTNAVLSTHFVLMQTDPEYQQLHRQAQEEYDSENQ